MRRRRHYRPLAAVAMLALALMAFGAMRALAAPAEASVMDAWRAAQARGGYHFVADVLQTVSPKAAVANAGRQSHGDKVHLEGSADFEAGEMAFTLWSQGGNVLDADSGTQVRIDESGAYARQGMGGWEPVPDFSTTLAPGGDFLAFLEAARSIEEVEEESQAGISYKRYTFDLNGPALAARMREALERQMTARGELPAGLSLALPELYARMTGRGELWVGEDGLPRRQRLWLQFPETEGERVAAEVDVVFSGFGIASETGGVVGAMALHLRRILAGPDVMGAAAGNAGVLALFAGLFFLLLDRRGARRLSDVITLCCVAVLVFTPLLQAVQAAGAEARVGARRALQEEATAQSEMQKRLRSLYTEPRRWRGCRQSHREPAGQCAARQRQPAAACSAEWRRARRLAAGGGGLADGRGSR